MQVSPLTACSEQSLKCVTIVQFTGWDNQIMQGDDAHTDTCLYCTLNLIKANKLITDLLGDKTLLRKLICFLVVAPERDNTVLLHKGHQGN